MSILPSRLRALVAFIAALAVSWMAGVGLAGPASAAVDPASLIHAGCLVALVDPDPALTRVTATLADGSVQSWTGPSRLASGALYGGMGAHAGQVITSITATLTDGTSATVAGRADCAAPANTTGPSTTTSSPTGLSAVWSCTGVTVTGSGITSTLLTTTSGVSVQTVSPARDSVLAAAPAAGWPEAVQVSLAAGGRYRAVSPLVGCSPTPVITLDVLSSTGLSFRLTCTSLALTSAPAPVDQIIGQWTAYAGGATSSTTLDLTPAATSSAPLAGPTGTYLSAFSFWYAGDTSPQPLAPYSVDCSALGGGGVPPVPPVVPPVPPIVIPPTPPPAVQASPIGLLASNPVPGTGVSAGSVISYRLDAVSPGVVVDEPVTLRLPRPVNASWVGTAHAVSTDPAVGSVDLTPDAAGDLIATGTLPVAGSFTIFASASAGVSGSTVQAQGFVNSLATNETQHPVLGASAPPCTPLSPAGLCTGVQVPGQDAPADCLDSQSITRLSPVAAGGTGTPEVSTDTNATLTAGMVAMGCDPILNPAIPDPAPLLADLETASSRRPGSYAVDVLTLHRTCTLTPAGIVVACVVQPYTFQHTSAQDTISPAPVPPVPPVPPVVVTDPPPAPPVVTDPPPTATPTPPVPAVVSDPPSPTVDTTPTPAPPAVLPAPPEATPTPAPPAVLPGQPHASRLPFTGAPTETIALVGLGAVAVGGGLLLATRRTAR